MVRFGYEPFLECSSRGDRRFSAFYAQVGGRSIEDRYQAAKIFADGATGLTWREAKGRLPVNIEAVRVFYSELWDCYFDAHPELLEVIRYYGGFSDMFGQAGHACQAEEVWRIKNVDRGIV